MLERMKEFLKQNDMCVLATCSDNKPHTSLMSYITDPEGTIVYMVTHRSTRKWHNIISNPQVSLLVDTRPYGPASERGKIKALTVQGICRFLEDKKTKHSLVEEIVKQHPHLSTLAYHPDAEVVAVTVESFLLLDGVSEAHFEMIP